MAYIYRITRCFANRVPQLPQPLHDTLMVAANLYNIINVILRFFFHAIAITTDLQKMYRQIAIHERNRDYQKRTTTKKVDFSHIFQSLMFKLNFMSNVSS